MSEIESADAVPEIVLTIGELETRTGVPAATLRSWERRMGFPRPVRSAGGQRRYRVSDVETVMRVQAERSRGLSLPAAVDSVVRRESVGSGSLYARLKAHHPELDVLRVGFKVMQAMTSAIEDEALAHASAPYLVGGFQNRESFLQSGRRWRELARSATLAVVMSDFAHHDAQGSPVRVALPPEAPMLNEWAIICDDAELCVALVAWEVPRRGEAGDRRFEAVLTLDPDIVHLAVRLCLDTAREAGLEDLDDPTPASGMTEDPRRTASLLRRFAIYADH